MSDVMPMTPAQAQHLAQVAAQLAEAAHGSGAAIKATACAALGISPATLHRWLDKLTTKPERKQRSDAGAVTLPRHEAVTISALLQSSARNTGTRLLSISQAVDTLRANGEIRAEFLDPATGELRPLSVSAIVRALRHYRLHPDQLSRAAPAQELRSLHPNHVWELDASLCVLYYLHAERDAESGLQVMEHDAFYKNKPRNLKRIEADRVWSYEATDHYAGYIFLRYAMGAESAQNAAEALIDFMHPREGEVAHGVPLILYTDQGIKAALFTNLLRRLGIRHELHAARNARATGQVEGARQIIQTSFESALRLRRVNDLDELNAQARRWAGWYNAHKTHSRHGRTRADMWLTITAEQLRNAPGVQVCRELMSAAPESRVVSPTLTANFRGAEWDVRAVPGVAVGERVMVATNPYAQDAIYVVERDAEGYETLYAAPRVSRDEGGFRVDANVIGEDRARPADTVLDANRKEVERAIYDAATDAEAAAAKKTKAVPFGGRIDPYKPMERDLAQAAQRSFMPKRGTTLEVGAAVAPSPTPAPVVRHIAASAPVAPAPLLTHFQATQRLHQAHGVAMTPELLAALKALYPEGVPDEPEALQALATRLTAQAAPQFALRVVNGGA